jgi:hypothetical protein
LNFNNTAAKETGTADQIEDDAIYRAKDEFRLLLYFFIIGHWYIMNGLDFKWHRNIVGHCHVIITWFSAVPSRHSFDPIPARFSNFL